MQRTLRGLKNKLFGHAKEQDAAKWLQQRGFEIVAQNYRFNKAEIDLIGLHNTEQRLVFFEVKYRQNADYGHPAEQLSAAQQARIRLAAQHFLLTHPHYADYSMQFDLLAYSDDILEPQHIENAFGFF
ncbi:YraN family protein [Thiomicrorhabdus cannonii]|uniref:YraN family protein n=1 Tax=Thiomicrorhabdus cannonii TaxID=2748011 RepID=UPI0015B937C2|nr:YraN family protein [Thiomicrorhabdus cannonii]